MNTNQKNFLRPEFAITILVIWQFFSVLLMVIGNWPWWVVWISLSASLIFLLLADNFLGLLFLIVSMPFYTVIPNTGFDSLATWRILFAVFFLKWFFQQIVLNRQKIKFHFWDKLLGIYLAWSFFVTVAFGRFRSQGLKQILFLLNIYIFYLAAAHIIKTKEQIIKTVKFAVYSLAIIIALGFAQLFFTFFVNLDTFWVYWASFISRLYYGNYFASVALESNSWFSYNGVRELRMFSIMPDSQSFAYMCIFGVCLGTALTFTVSRKARAWLWRGIRFAGLALMLSGTRAVWVGMAAPFFALIAAWKNNFMKPAVKKFFWPFLIIIILFSVSPLFNKGLDYLRAGGRFKENFLERAKSVYDLNDISNAGRIAIWKSSLAFSARHPLGAGLGNFLISQNPDSLKNYTELSTQVNKRYNLPERYVSAHSLYLQVLVETGIFGFLIFVCFFLYLLKDIWKFLKHNKDNLNFSVVFVFQFGLALLWVLLAGIFDVTLFNDKVLMIFLLMLAMTRIIIKELPATELEDQKLS